MVSQSVVTGGAEASQPIRSQDGHLYDQIMETGTGSESDFRETRAREDHIKNLPVGQMEILMSIPAKELGTRIFTCASIRLSVGGIHLDALSQMRGYLDPAVAPNLRFLGRKRSAAVRRRSSGSLAGLPPGGQS